MTLLDIALFFDNFLKLLLLVLFFIALFLFGKLVFFLLFHNHDLNIRKYIYYCSGIIIFIVVSAFLSMTFLSYAFDSSLKIMVEESSHVYVDSVLLERKNSEDLVSRIIDRDSIKMSGSRPTISILVVLQGASRRLEFLLRRDSRDQDVYWVFLVDAPYSGSLGYVEIPAELMMSIRDGAPDS